MLPPSEKTVLSATTFLKMILWKEMLKNSKTSWKFSPREAKCPHVSKGSETGRKAQVSGTRVRPAARPRPAGPIAAAAAPAAAGEERELASGWACALGPRGTAAPAAPALAVSPEDETGCQPRVPHHPCLEGIPLEDSDVSRKIKTEEKRCKHKTLEAQRQGQYPGKGLIPHVK